MKRSGLSRTIVAIAMMLIGWLPSLAHDFEVEGVFYNKTSDIAVAVTYKGDSYNSYSDEYVGNVVIPSSVNYNGTTYSVTSIGDKAFYYCLSLTSVQIPNSVTSIGDNAFYWCSDLTSFVVDAGNSKYVSRNGCNAIIETASNTLIAGCQNTIIPNSVTSIGDCAFCGCTSLTSIEIPNSVTSIGDYAFGDCSGLTSVVWNAKKCSDFTYFDDSPFKDSKNITSFTFGDSVEHIPAYLCSRMSSLTSIKISNSVTSIGGWAFRGCSGLTSMEIPNGVTSIRQYAI